MIEIVCEQVECRVRNDFSDLGIGDSRVTCRGEVVVGNETTLLDELICELQDGVGFSVDCCANSGFANLLWS